MRSHLVIFAAGDFNLTLAVWQTDIPVFTGGLFPLFCKSHGFNSENILPPLSALQAPQTHETTSETPAVLPRKALGIVILSHMRSLTSRPDSGEAIALATDAMSECRDKLKSSKPGRRKRSVWLELKRAGVEKENKYHYFFPERPEPQTFQRRKGAYVLSR